VLGAAVPVAAVDEHYHTGAAEQQVCCPAQVALRSHVDPVTQSRGVHQAAYRQFRLRVVASVALHGLPSGSAGSPRYVHGSRLRTRCEQFAFVGTGYDALEEYESFGRRKMGRPLELKAMSPEPNASSQRRKRSGEVLRLG